MRKLPLDQIDLFPGSFLISGTFKPNARFLRNAVVNVPFDRSTNRPTTIDQEIKANATICEIDRFSIGSDNHRFRDPLITPPSVRVHR